MANIKYLYTNSYFVETIELAVLLFFIEILFLNFGSLWEGKTMQEAICQLQAGDDTEIASHRWVGQQVWPLITRIWEQMVLCVCYPFFFVN